uniref:carbonic anhydrase n=1 Tax=viral metagenome TaxID=1070528 RepID=A0A6C0DPZ1_9ZZZZ
MIKTHENKSSVYQSPICLEKSIAIPLQQHIEIFGKNENAIYNHDTKNFEVQENVFITLNSKKYKLEEYHFHIPSEHKINGQKYAAEIHYVFFEYTDNDQCLNNNQPKHSNKDCRDVCGCHTTYSENIIVIGRLIQHAEIYRNLVNIQVKVPHYYYQYDGTLTTGNYSPVRWIIGENPVHYDFEQLLLIAKSVRELQNLDGRIILYSEK